MSDESAAPAAPVEAQEAAPEVIEAEEAVDAQEGEGSKDAPKADAKKEGTVDKAINALKKKFNLTVGGKARDVEIDLGNEKEVKRYLEQAFGAQEKFEEAAGIRKQAEQLVKMLKENPKMLLKHPELGLDIKKLATEILNEELEDMAKSPEQKRIEEMEQKLKDYEEEKKRLEEERRNAEMSKVQQEAMQQLDEDISQALSSSTLPKSPYVVKRIADTMIEAINLGYENVRIPDIMPYVEQQLLAEIQQMFEAKPSDVLEKMIGKKTLDGYRKEKIAKVKRPADASQVKETGAKSDQKADDKDNLAFKKVFSTF